MYLCGIYRFTKYMDVYGYQSTCSSQDWLARSGEFQEVMFRLHLMLYELPKDSANLDSEIYNGQ